MIVIYYSQQLLRLKRHSKFIKPCTSSFLSTNTTQQAKKERGPDAKADPKALSNIKH